MRPNGNAMGMNYLAGCYCEGIGVAKNDLLADRWLQKSADAGYAPAAKELADERTAQRAQALKALFSIFAGGSSRSSGDEEDAGDRMARQSAWQRGEDAFQANVREQQRQADLSASGPTYEPKFFAPQ